MDMLKMKKNARDKRSEKRRKTKANREPSPGQSTMTQLFKVDLYEDQQMVQERAQLAKKSHVFDYQGDTTVGGRRCEREFFRDFLKKEDTKAVEVEVKYKRLTSTSVAVKRKDGQICCRGCN